MYRLTMCAAARFARLFDFDAVPTISKAQVVALAAGNGRLEKGANCLLFRVTRKGQESLGTAIGLHWMRTAGARCSANHRFGAEASGRWQ
jgi:hypothetical protein